MVEMYLLEQLVAFADAGTLSGAAEQLHITQPALSRSMRKLEALLGVSLFERSASRIALNATGVLAAEQARIVLGAEQSLEERVRAFDRSLRTISVGGCAPYPLGEALAAVQQCLAGMAVTSEIAPDGALLDGLAAHRYQLVVLHAEPVGEGLAAQSLFSERLAISVPAGHPLAERASVRFADLAGASILVNGDVGFWMDVCRQELPHAGLLVQEGIEQLDRLAEASNLPVFSTDRTIARLGEPAGRTSIPIEDDAAQVTYWLACLASEQKRFANVFAALGR